MVLDRIQGGRVRSWAHRKGIAREVNACYGAKGWETVVVDTARPWRWLARFAARSWNTRIEEKERTGRSRWRWKLRYGQRWSSRG